MLTTPEDHRKAFEIGEAFAKEDFARALAAMSIECAESRFAGMLRGYRRLIAAFVSEAAATRLLRDELNAGRPTADAMARLAPIDVLAPVRLSRAVKALFRAGFASDEIHALFGSALSEAEVDALLHTAEFPLQTQDGLDGR